MPWGSNEMQKCKGLTFAVMLGVSSIALAEDERLLGEPTVSPRGRMVAGLGFGSSSQVLGDSKSDIFVYDATVGGSTVSQPIVKFDQATVPLSYGMRNLFVG